MSSFTPEARVIAAFSVVVALLMGGWHHVGMLTMWFVVNLPSSLGSTGMTVIPGAAVVLVAVATLLVARSAAAIADAPWATHLGQATVALSVVVIAGAILGAAGAAVANGGFGYYFGIPG